MSTMLDSLPFEVAKILGSPSVLDISTSGSIALGFEAVSVGVGTGFEEACSW